MITDIRRLITCATCLVALRLKRRSTTQAVDSDARPWSLHTTTAIQSDELRDSWTTKETLNESAKARLEEPLTIKNRVISLICKKITDEELAELSSAVL